MPLGIAQNLPVLERKKRSRSFEIGASMPVNAAGTEQWLSSNQMKTEVNVVEVDGFKI